MSSGPQEYAQSLLVYEKRWVAELSATGPRGQEKGSFGRHY